ncbi:MAG: twin-arginine translocase subunit TatC [Chloroflexia bacterium]
MPTLFRRRSPPTSEVRPENQGKMSLLEHLEELRRRLLICLVAIAVATVVAFIFSDALMEVLLRLAGPETHIQAIEVPEKFTTSLRLSLTVGIALAMPVLVYQTWQFLRPALFPHEKRYILLGLPLVILFFIGGVLFSYFLALPAALRFLLNFGSSLVSTQPQLGPYLSFISTLLLWSGISFELPIFLFFLAKIHVLDWRRLARWRKYAFLLICVLAAVITPTPDPVNMLIVALPLYVLYEIGLLLARLA